MSRGRSSAIAALATIAAAAGACGGEEDRGATSDYLARADAICAKRKTTPGRATENVRELAPAIQRQVQDRERTLAELRRLSPPDAIEDDVESYLDATEKLIEEEREELAIARRNDLIAFEHQDLEVSLASADRLRIAVEIGFRRCAQPVGRPPITPAAFLPEEIAEEADSACRAADDAVIEAGPDRYRDIRDLAPTYARSRSARERAAEQLALVEPPSNSGRQWRAFLDRYRKRIALLPRLEAAAKAGDRDRFDAIAADDGRLYERENALAQQLGLTVCGQGTTLGV